MKALVFHAVGGIRLDEVRDPQLQAPTDAIVGEVQSLGHGIAEKFDVGPNAPDAIERIPDVPSDDEDGEFLADRPAAGRRPDESVTSRPDRRHLGLVHGQ
jgi:hypothetical protein